jgi:hypothetical protein
MGAAGGHGGRQKEMHTEEIPRHFPKPQVLSPGWPGGSSSEPGGHFYQKKKSFKVRTVCPFPTSCWMAGTSSSSDAHGPGRGKLA